MIGEGFVSYKGFRWLWICAAILGACGYLYLFIDPSPIQNGRTPLGYWLGIVCAIIIIILMWFGIRKRSFYNRYTTLKGCLAAHIWLGLILVLLVPLHSGFQFGWNLHTYAYLIMLATIASGVLGVVIYVRYPAQVIAHRGGGSVKLVVDRLSKLTQEIDFLAKDRSDEFLKIYDAIDVHFEPTVLKCLMGKAPKRKPAEEVAKLMAQLPSDERDEGRELVQLIEEKQGLYRQLENDTRVLVLFRSWLYMHVPLSVGLTAAVIAHVLSVSIYSW